MGSMASQITSLTIVYAAVYSGADQRKQRSSASLAIVRGIHRGPVNSLHKWPVTRKMFPFDDVIMVDQNWPDMASRQQMIHNNVILMRKRRCNVRSRHFFLHIVAYWCQTAVLIWASIYSGNCLLPDDTKSLPEPMLIHHKWDAAFIWGQFTGNAQGMRSPLLVRTWICNHIRQTTMAVINHPCAQAGLLTLDNQKYLGRLCTHLAW